MKSFTMPQVFPAILLVAFLVFGLDYCEPDSHVEGVFGHLEKGFRRDKLFMQNRNKALMDEIECQAVFYKNSQIEKYLNRAHAVDSLVRSTLKFIDLIQVDINWAYHGNQLYSSNFISWGPRHSSSTRAFLRASNGLNYFSELQQRLRSLKQFLVDCADQDESVAKMLDSLDNDFSSITESQFKAQSASETACRLTRCQLNALEMEYVILKYCQLKTAYMDMEGSGYDPMVSCRRGYVLPGELYKTDVHLSAYTTTAYQIELAINGKTQPMKEGYCHFQELAIQPGINDFSVQSTVHLKWMDAQKRKIIQQTVTSAKTFSYYVYPTRFARSKPNGPQTLYAEMDNLMYISTPDSVHVSAAGAAMKNLGNNAYILHPAQPGKTTLTLTNAYDPPWTIQLDVLPLPDPIPVLNDSIQSGSISVDGLRLLKYLSTRFREDLDITVVCPVRSYQITLFHGRDDPQTIENKGGLLSEESLRLIQSAQQNDRLVFDEIQVVCPGDQQPRSISGISLKVR